MESQSEWMVKVVGGVMYFFQSVFGQKVEFRVGIKVSSYNDSCDVFDFFFICE